MPISSHAMELFIIRKKHPLIFQLCTDALNILNSRKRRKRRKKRSYDEEPSPLNPSHGLAVDDKGLNNLTLIAQNSNEVVDVSKMPLLLSDIIFEGKIHLDRFTHRPFRTIRN